MAREASKTNRLRDPATMARLFAGRVLDIGCGDDPVVPHARPFDRAHGDAGRILDYLPAASFDCVHSSHCLEHMADVPGALAQWWALVRPGGLLVLVVPDEDLYEQGVWPSLFNADHKASFRLDRPAAAWAACSYHLRPLLAALPGAEILSLRLQDDGYDHRRRRPIGGWGRRLWRASMWRSAVLRRLGGERTAVRTLDRVLSRLEVALGRPEDQTAGDALAQIEAVVHRRSG